MTTSQAVAAAAAVVLLTGGPSAGQNPPAHQHDPEAVVPLQPRQTVTFQDVRDRWADVSLYRT